MSQPYSLGDGEWATRLAGVRDEMIRLDRQSWREETIHHVTQQMVNRAGAYLDALRECEPDDGDAPQ